MKRFKVHRLPTEPVKVLQYRPRQVFEFDESDGLPHFEFFDIPDPAHQSSLDYLAGV